MFGFSRIEEHSELVTKMSEALGVDFDVEIQAGRMTPEDLREIVFRCTGCAESCECRTFLSENPAGTADQAPQFCRNKGMLEALARGE